MMMARQDEARRGVQLVLEDLERRAGQGDADAMYRMARLYERGYDSIPSDTVRSMELYRMAAEGGNPAAQNYYGYLLYNGKGAERDPVAGMEWMSKAAQSGDLTAANNLGWIIVSSDTPEKDYATAARWLRKAADGGVPSAMSMLADLYREGRGVEKDTLQAISLYNRAIEAGLYDAQLKLLNMQAIPWQSLTPTQAVETGLYYYTHGAPAIGVTLFEQAASRGDARAMALMGDALTRALGASYNHDLALQYYYRAAIAGDPSAQFVIAELLEIFPDSLEALPESEYYPAVVPEEYSAPGYWMEKARAAGIYNAEQATSALLRQ